MLVEFFNAVTVLNTTRHSHNTFRDRDQNWNQNNQNTSGKNQIELIPYQLFHTAQIGGTFTKYIRKIISYIVCRIWWPMISRLTVKIWFVIKFLATVERRTVQFSGTVAAGLTRGGDPDRVGFSSPLRLKTHFHRRDPIKIKKSEKIQKKISISKSHLSQKRLDGSLCLITLQLECSKRIPSSFLFFFSLRV